MIVTEDWRDVEFHDAMVRAVVWSGDRVFFDLEHLCLLSGHPMNTTGEPVYLDKACLVFDHPTSVSARSYSSKAGTWQDLDRPYPHMLYISEVVIEDATTWKISGFDERGVWLEWVIRVGDGVRLDI